ncbi:MAG: rhomboid family intramembrane serine protease [Saprospiraceae bacterium]|jgi:membrane associated rhomboid family serine protease|nr:rhomboid family intramembrane serine protease [Saprospiraceae bacterium]
MNVTIVIVAITCLVSWLAFNSRHLFDKLCHYPFAEFNRGEKFRWITGGLIHADVFHLFINMYVLYEFGKMVEYYFTEIHGFTAGMVMYATFYFFTLVLSNVPTYMKHRDNAHFRSVGASGATSAIVFSFIVFEPTAMLGLFFILPIPAVLFGILYLFYSSWAGKKNADNIDHEAHLYGAVAGFLFTIAMKPALFSLFIHKIVSVF